MVSLISATHLPDGRCRTPTNFFRARRGPPSTVVSSASVNIPPQAMLNSGLCS
ncbi:hypothetical protein HanIR_Chr09g0432131 [Helianthus annuus]|nr:hypothetical protein HanIR_Chr09g0432131 [Helianthus annuus]